MGLRDLGRRLKAARRGEGCKGARRAPDEGAGANAEPLADLTERMARVEATAPNLHASLVRLDPYQLSAVLTDEPVVSLRAQVGSGKTTVLAHKVVLMHRVEGIPLADMAVLTFTQKAAAEIADRVRALGGEVRAGDLRYFGTFHAVAAAILREEGAAEVSGRSPRFGILDEEERLALLDEIVEKDGLSIKYRARLAMRLEALEQGRPLVGAMKYPDDIVLLRDRYEEEKRRRDLFDFDDLILWGTRVLEGGAGARPRWAAVDEFQDCDPSQLAFLRAWMRRGDGAKEVKHRGLFVVGDPHQLVYSFRGGDARIFEDFEADFGARVFRLPCNYRSTDAILLAARAVLGGRCGRLTGTRDAGTPLRLLRHHDPTQEALYLARRLERYSSEERRETAILFRKREQARPIAEALDAAAIPHAGIHGEVAAGTVSLLTFHGAKGLEFDTVFLVGVNDGLVPLASSFGDPEAESEEQRLLFVGMTRARDRLEISYLADPRDFGARPEKSRFLDLIPESLIEDEIPHLDAEPSAIGHSPGARVAHSRYGAGRVLAVNASTVTVHFDLHGVKTFSLAFGDLGLEGLAADES